MEEWIDILDAQGNYTGKSCLKTEAHAKGYFHPTVHIWLYTKNKHILFQKRALTKLVFPGMWDISVAGHVAAGEVILDAAMRETKEEIGLRLTKTNLTKIGVRKHMVAHPNGIQDNEFHHVFIAELNVPVTQLKRQETEVAALQLFPLDTLTKTAALENVLLPRFHDYYCKVYDAILEQLS
ncbi:NUDIX domain-containing protein [Tenacibaculum sp. SG-28]|uniref:NUDIX hydrolase n=1 Tax=Tenacibaculum sp. SG-28 TaxID=754426 RepID=UPI000CF3AD63|nr:NUDIX domain-containing protein [Tenacibaculum sp. SG-28]PQJ23428.1 hydrolase [Tenacibaculum sp. SG-28]